MQTTHLNRQVRASVVRVSTSCQPKTSQPTMPSQALPSAAPAHLEGLQGRQRAVAKAPPPLVVLCGKGSSAPAQQQCGCASTQAWQWLSPGMPRLCCSLHRQPGCVGGLLGGCAA